MGQEKCVKVHEKHSFIYFGGRLIQSQPIRGELFSGILFAFRGICCIDRKKAKMEGVSICFIKYGLIIE